MNVKLTIKCIVYWLLPMALALMQSVLFAITVDEGGPTAAGLFFLVGNYIVYVAAMFAWLRTK